MALTNLRVRLARPMAGRCVAERPMVGNCVAEKHTHSMRQLRESGMRSMCLEIWTTEQIVDIPVPQIEEELVEANSIGTSERTQQHINEPNLIVWNGIRNPYFEKVPQHELV